MSKPDADRAMEIYRNFTRQTDFVVAYLSVARQYEHQTRVEVPKLKHAPVNLGKQLEDYLADPDFEINRRQYLAEQESKGGKAAANGAGKLGLAPKSEIESRAAAGRAFPDVNGGSSSKSSPPVKGPAPDLIDFFGSIEQPVQPQQEIQQPQFTGAPFQIQQQQQLQNNGFVPQQTAFQNSNPFPQPNFNGAFENGSQGPQGPQQAQGPQQPQQLQQTGFGIAAQQPQSLQPSFTGAGFGGYTPQSGFQPGNLSSIPQDSAASFQNQGQQQLGHLQTGQQTTNPFRLSMMQTGMSGPSFPASPPVTSPMPRQSTNPFAKSIPTQTQPYTPPPDQQFQQAPPQPAPIRPAATGTNPFARNLSAASAPRPQTSGGATQFSTNVMSQPTGLMSQPTGLAPQPTGSTNPFRQSQFVNTSTGMGWQNNQQPIGGGLDQLPTVPVFPRPAQQQAWQQ